ncbi:MAG TPA: penicillin-binding protein 2 [candidate division CPR3 bacterium]|uniref:Penicillin-binding protein 2 n=1 Tax=candidate division CPR3 bacterium TaxID=2268181 RepID=A0A7C1SRD4_UNCC3|nr:penicillin-binding protein 2 [candidate division CPR3 bacterium]
MFGLPFFKDKGSFVTRSSKEVEFQEVFLDKLAANQQEREGGFERKIEIPLSQFVLRVLYFGFVVILTVFFIRTGYLQIVQGEELSERAKMNAIRSIAIAAERGVMYDSSGIQLVFNRPSFDLVCDKLEISQKRGVREDMFKELAGLSDFSFEDLKDVFDRQSSSTMLIGENLSHEELIMVETRLENLEGCWVQENTIREYVQGSVLSHLLGYTAKVSPEELEEFSGYGVTDQIGKVGVEQSFESVLRGKPGAQLFERDAYGKIVKDKGEIPSEPGESLVLWMDLGLQEKVTQALSDNLKRIGSKKGVVIAMDPRSGGILSLVSMPGFDINAFSGGISQKEYSQLLEDPAEPLFNRAVGGLYPTGSTIKPLVASAALAEDIIDPDELMFTQGYIEVPNRYDPEIVYKYLDWKNHGWVDMRDAIAVSSNVYFYTIGGGYGRQEGLGPSRITQYLSLFGWGEKTGIDIQGEKSGLLPTPEWKQEVKGEGWWDGDTYLLSIGQGNLLTTPLQVVRAFSAIANNGTVFELQVVKEIVRDEGQQKIESVVVREDIIEQEILQIVREGMRQAVTSGSSVLLNSLSVEVAAKTGTAQTPDPDILHNWVTVFAPYENPEIVLTVLIEDVRGEQIAALPIAKEILEWYFSQ